jgi:PKHD-type hydroxylase
VSFPGALSAQEISRIHSLLDAGEWLAAEDFPSTEDGLPTVEGYRVARLQWLMPPHIDWLYSRLAEYVREANGRWFGFDLDGFHDPLQATLYEAPVQGRYDWHIDRGTHANNNPPRKLTVVVQLSDSVSYIGGDLEILVDRMPQSLDRTRGSVHVFPSFVLHRITPVEAGSRLSIVGWITGPRFR